MKLQIFYLLGATAVAGCARTHPAPIVEKATPPEPYHAPLHSPGAQFSTLPPAVQNTIRAETGSAEIASIRKETNQTGSIDYVIRFDNRELYPPLYVAQDGSLLDTNRIAAAGGTQDRGSIGEGGGVSSSLTLEDVPAEVAQAILSRAPAAEIASIYKETWGDRTLYVVAFTDEARYPKLYVAADGTIESQGTK
jgi:hypothetical protein